MNFFTNLASKNPNCVLSAKEKQKRFDIDFRTVKKWIVFWESLAIWLQVKNIDHHFFKWWIPKRHQFRLWWPKNLLDTLKDTRSLILIPKRWDDYLRLLLSGVPHTCIVFPQNINCYVQGINCRLVSPTVTISCARLSDLQYLYFSTLFLLAKLFQCMNLK